MSEGTPLTVEYIEKMQQEGSKRIQEAMEQAKKEQAEMQQAMFEQQQQEALLQQQFQQAQQQQPQIESCGGPLVCVNCAMKYAQAYLNAGKGVWADYYYRHGIKLRNEAEIGRLHQENQQLALQNAALEKDMWKTHTGSNGVS